MGERRPVKAEAAGSIPVTTAREVWQSARLSPGTRRFGRLPYAPTSGCWRRAYEPRPLGSIPSGGTAEDAGFDSPSSRKAMANDPVSNLLWSA